MGGCTPEQSPHELRQAAEAKLAEAEVEIERLRSELASHKNSKESSA